MRWDEPPRPWSHGDDGLRAARGRIGILRALVAGERGLAEAFAKAARRRGLSAGDRVWMNETAARHLAHAEVIASRLPSTERVEPESDWVIGRGPRATG
jgi:hypothetical protein